ncbi:hypothetical protein GIR35_12420 [Enterococcus faecalis]|nr:hypothetical protein GIR35_12420 [Enterococcus faecalis]
MLDWLNGWICETLANIALWIFNVYNLIVNQIGNVSFITGSLSSIFGGEGVWNVVTSVHQSLVIPLGESILALFMLVQLVKISQRIDATSTLPAVKDIVFLAVVYVLMHWIIVNSLDLAQAVYDIFNNIAVNPDFVNKTVSDTPFIDSETAFAGVDFAKANIGSCFALVIVGLLSILTGIAALVVATVVAIARALQIYVMVTFSPIPLAFLGFEETRQSGISFIRNFCAAGLAGAIIMFILTAYPYIATAMLTGITGGGDAGSNIIMGLASIINFTGGTSMMSISGIIGIITWASTSVLLILGLAKSGAWAKEILGS